MARKVVLAGACRTAIGVMGGTLSKTPAPDLGTVVIKEALKRTGIKPEAQSVAVAHDLGFNNDILNVNGGAIALGHPVGASGCRILVTLLHEMEKRDAKKGLATLCVGGGMGCAAIVERE